MRVAMYYKNDDIRLEEMGKPALLPGEILVKVKSSGICGSDVMEWYRIKKAPIVLGHELSGDIAEVGEGVKDFAVADRVVFTHHVPCNNCRYCLEDKPAMCETLRSTKFYPGGFSEYVRVPAINIEKGGVLKMPDSVSYEEGTFVEPVGCAVRGHRKANVSPGSSVLVLGSGLSGLIHIQLAKAFGAGRIVATDVNDYRLEYALKMGADFSFNAMDENMIDNLLAANDGRGYDFVIICTAVPVAFKQAMKAVDKGGTVLVYAINTPGTEMPFDIYDFYNRGITLIATYAASPRDLAEALRLIQHGRVETQKLITHRLPLKDTVEGFQLMVKGGESMKVIIDPQA